MEINHLPLRKYNQTAYESRGSVAAGYGCVASTNQSSDFSGVHYEKHTDPAKQQKMNSTFPTVVPLISVQ